MLNYNGMFVSAKRDLFQAIEPQLEVRIASLRDCLPGGRAAAGVVMTLPPVYFCYSSRASDSAVANDRERRPTSRFISPPDMLSMFATRLLGRKEKQDAFLSWIRTNISPIHQECFSHLNYIPC